MQGGEGILRHFDASADLEPLFLINLHYDSRSLDFELVSFTAPLRTAPKWPKGLDGGTRLRLIGSTNRLNINAPAFFCETSLETIDCKMKGVEWREGKFNEREFDGVMLELRQNGDLVINAECAALRLGGIQPFDNDEADRYRNPERYA
ncbi:hypothetical protein [Novipirellula galeiformis]|uniref:hypothetical protein n=1 Tax=Novipirellula galeiformis TaxID=2528004 RepID=UPI0011B62EF2|nr:hypothetical protein [Novipirellula galeiformis]